MHIAQASPELRLLWHKFVYAAHRLAAGQISPEDYKQLREMACGRKEVNKKLVRRCFPHAYDSLVSCAKELKVGTWTHEAVTMACYHRPPMCHTGGWELVGGKVLKARVNSQTVTLTGPEGLVFTAANPYGFTLHDNEMVVLNGRIIVEKYEDVPHLRAA